VRFLQLDVAASCVTLAILKDSPWKFNGTNFAFTDIEARFPETRIHCDKRAPRCICSNIQFTPGWYSPWSKMVWRIRQQPQLSALRAP